MKVILSSLFLYSRIMPYCIKHLPGVVLDVVLSTAVENVHVDSSMAALSLVLADSPCPADTPTTSLPADSLTNQAGNFYMYLQPYSKGDVISCVISNGAICTKRGAVDKANACMIDDDLLKVRNSVRPWCSMHAGLTDKELKVQCVLYVGENPTFHPFKSVKQVHIKGEGLEIEIQYAIPEWTDMWVTGRCTWEEVTLSPHPDGSDWVMYVPEEYVTGDTMPVFKSLQRFDREPKPVREARANRLDTQESQGKQDSTSICEKVSKVSEEK